MLFSTVGALRRFDLLKSGYAALHDLILGTWYAQPESWAAIGYPGPPLPGPMRDTFREGLATGWKHIDASDLTADTRYEADVAIIGSGAGGGVTPKFWPRPACYHHHRRRPAAYQQRFPDARSRGLSTLYQDQPPAKRPTRINILQGRCVGGSTTVNWTSSFRTQLKR